VKRVVPREIAEHDVDLAADFYTDEAGEDFGQAFVDTLEKTYRSIAERPKTGSLRLGEAATLPGLRTRRLSRFPYLVVYFEREDHIDVWRVLHVRRDLVAALEADRADS
jgi:toxin ParE1/3/4